MAEQKSTTEKKNKLKAWLKLRFNFRPIEKHIIYHRVAKHPWYYGDGASLLVLLVTLLLTGMFMALTYSPSPESAYESVKQITSGNLLGSFVRGLHYWSAGVVVVVLVYHMFRHIILGGYLPPREGTWLVGVIVFFLMITTSLIGYTLRWDERSVYALGIALNIFYKIPWIGEEIVYFVQGGVDLGRSTLSRLYAVHVLFVPFALFAAVGYHIYLVLTYGATTPLEKEYGPATAEEQIELRDREKNDPQMGQPFFPGMISKSGTVAFVVFLFVAGLAYKVGPQELYPEANLTEISFPQEEWWFHWYSALAAYLPPAISDHFHWLFPVVVFLSLILLPFLDRGDNRGAKRRPVALITVFSLVIVLLALTGLRKKSTWTAWPNTELPPLPKGEQLSASGEKGRQLFSYYGCFNCHSVGGKGYTFAPNLSGMDHRYSQDELFKFISQPPRGVPMPAYKDRLTTEELNDIVAFVLIIQTFPKEY